MYGYEHIREVYICPMAFEFEMLVAAPAARLSVAARARRAPAKPVRARARV